LERRCGPRPRRPPPPLLDALRDRAEGPGPGRLHTQVPRAARRAPALVGGEAEHRWHLTVRHPANLDRGNVGAAYAAQAPPEAGAEGRRDGLSAQDRAARLREQSPGVPVGDHLPWQLSGTYLESCNCEAICPCRSIGDRKGGRSTYGVCMGVLSWVIERGRAGEIDLSGLNVVLALRYSDDEPGSPWTFWLYLDERGDEGQREA